MNIVQPRPTTRGCMAETKRAPGRGGQAPLAGACAGRGIRRCADGPGEVAIRQDSI